VSDQLQTTCDELRADLAEFEKYSPVLLMNRRGKIAVQRTQTLLTQLAALATDVADLRRRLGASIPEKTK